MSVADSGGGVHHITPLQQLISSCSGALLTSLLTTPFDVVKVRIQAQQNSSLAKPCYMMECRCLDGVTLCAITPEGNHVHFPRFQSTLDAFLKIAKFEGVRSWWKGLSPTLVMAVPATMIYYTGYDQLKMVFGFRPEQYNILAPILAGTIARTAAVVAISPIELVRTKLQSRQGYKYRELVEAIRGAVRQNGVLSLWRGMSPMLLRDVPFTIVYWIGYEFLKLQLNMHLDHHYMPVVPFVSGCVSGAVSALLTNPLDVVKTHMQVELGESAGRPMLGAGSLFTVMNKVVSEHGYRGLFAGLGPRIAKVAPACAIMIGSYEAYKEYFAERNRLKYLNSQSKFH